MSTIKPTIGRKVWYWPDINDHALHINDTDQACDATVVYVHPDDTVNLFVIDHIGRIHARSVVTLQDEPTRRGIATWMPYQLGQAKKPVSTFRKDLETIINRHSMESGSNTPDFVLAQYLADCLDAFDKAMQARNRFYQENAGRIVGVKPSSAVHSAWAGSMQCQGSSLKPAVGTQHPKRDGLPPPGVDPVLDQVRESYGGVTHGG